MSRQRFGYRVSPIETEGRPIADKTDETISALEHLLGANDTDRLVNALEMLLENS